MTWSAAEGQIDAQTAVVPKPGFILGLLYVLSRFRVCVFGLLCAPDRKGVSYRRRFFQPSVWEYSVKTAMFCDSAGISGAALLSGFESLNLPASSRSRFRIRPSLFHDVSLYFPKSMDSSHLVVSPGPFTIRNVVISPFPQAGQTLSGSFGASGSPAASGSGSSDLIVSMFFLFLPLDRKP